MMYSKVWGRDPHCQSTIHHVDDPMHEPVGSVSYAEEAQPHRARYAAVTVALSKVAKDPCCSSLLDTSDNAVMVQC